MSKKRIISFLLAAMMLLSLCTACGPSGEGDTGGGDEDTLYLRLSTALQSTDWQQTAIMESSKITYIQLFEGLYGMDESAGGYYNLLAKDVQLSEDNLTYTIELVDATFQNGDPLTAEDVVFSYQLAMENPKFGYVTSMIDTVEAQGDKTVVVTLKFPYSAISHTFFTIKIYSKREYQEIVDSGVAFGTTPHTAGTGPYYVSEYDISAGVKLKAYENYWQGAPAIKKVTFKFIKEASSGAIALETGDVDIYADISMVDVPNLQSKKNIQVSLIQGDYLYFLCMNQQKELFQDVRVRQALAYAINIDELIQAVTDGIGGTKTGSMTTPSCFGYLEFDPIEQDVEKAKQLLAEAGYPNGISFEMVVCDGSRKKIGETLQGMLKKSNIDLKINMMEMSAMAEYAVASNHDTLPQVARGYIPDADSELTDKVVSDSWGNFSRMHDPHVDELMAAARQESDPDKRIEMYHEVQQIVHDEVHFIPLYYVNNVSAANANLKGFKTSTDLGYKIWELSW